MKEYAYFTSTEYLSLPFKNIKDLLEEFIRTEKGFKKFEDKKGKYTLVELAEIEYYEEEISVYSFLEDILNDVNNAREDLCDNYLDNIDTKDLQRELNKFWKSYKKKNKIAPAFYLSKKGTRRIYKVYYEEVDGKFKMLSYKKIK